MLGTVKHPFGLQLERAHRRVTLEKELTDQVGARGLRQRRIDGVIQKGADEDAIGSRPVGPGREQGNPRANGPHFDLHARARFLEVDAGGPFEHQAQEPGGSLAAGRIVAVSARERQGDRDGGAPGPLAHDQQSDGVGERRRPVPHFPVTGRSGRRVNGGRECCRPCHQGGSPVTSKRPGHSRHQPPSSAVTAVAAVSSMKAVMASRSTFSSSSR